MDVKSPEPRLVARSGRGDASVIGSILIMAFVVFLAALLMYFVFTFEIPTTQSADVSITQEQDGEVLITATNMGNADYLQIELEGISHTLTEDDLRLEDFNESMSLKIDKNDIDNGARIRVFGHRDGTAELIRDYEPAPPQGQTSPAPSQPSPNPNPVAGNCPDSDNWKADWDQNSEPYHVCTVEQLQSIDEYDRSAAYIQHDTIDASETSSWNSGRGFEPIDRFTGEYDGNGYTIKNMTIDRPYETYVSVFSRIGGDGTVQNVTIANSTITGKEQVGGIVGLAQDSTVRDITITGTDITARATLAGGAIGQVGSTTDSEIHDITVDGTVTAEYSSGVSTDQPYAFAGGVVGRVKDAGAVDFYNLHSQADVTSHDHKAGGLIAWLGTGSTLRDSSATDGTVELKSGTWAGGAVAAQAPTATIKRTYTTNTVIADGDTVGGLVGVARGVIRDSYSHGDVKASGQEYVGGLVGHLDNTSIGEASITRSYSTGTPTGSGYVGGLVGESEGSVTDSYWDTQTSNTSTSADGTGLNTGQMQGNAAKNHMFSDWSAWSLGESGSYPHLTWEE